MKEQKMNWRRIKYRKENCKYISQKSYFIYDHNLLFLKYSMYENCANLKTLKFSHTYRGLLNAMHPPIGTALLSP